MRKLLKIGAVALGGVGVLVCAAAVGIGWWAAVRAATRLDRVVARRWIARIMVGWGLVSMGTMFITDVPSFMAARVLLGIAVNAFGHAPPFLVKAEALFGTGEDAPGISTVMMEAFNIVQDRIARSRLAGDPPDAVISPRLGEFSLFDFHRADEIIKRGVSAAEREVEDIAREIQARRRFRPAVIQQRSA